MTYKFLKSLYSLYKPTHKHVHVHNEWMSERSLSWEYPITQHLFLMKFLRTSKKRLFFANWLKDREWEKERAEPIREEGKQSGNNISWHNHGWKTYRSLEATFTGKETMEKGLYVREAEMLHRTWFLDHPTLSELRHKSQMPICTSQRNQRIRLS